MGKRGPESKPEERGKRRVFYAKKPCNDALEKWRPKAKNQLSPVICAAMKLAERHPDEFQAILAEHDT